jgi:hypothetical protein
MLLAETNTTVVGRLRIRSKALDPRAEQQRVLQLLRSATLSPAGLPASATLVVRRLSDPLPKRLRVRPFVSEPDATWQRAVNNELDRILAAASRPVMNAVPAGANAVLFLDRAEVLASLALNWLQGSLTANWWWRWLLPSRADARASLFAEWARTPEFVPAAMEMLSRRSLAVQFVQAIPPAVVNELRAKVCSAHGLRDLGLIDSTHMDIDHGKKSDLETPVRTIGDGHDSGPRTATKSSHGPSPSQADTYGTREPWLPWVPEASAAGLAPDARLLLAQCLLVTRAPIEARSHRLQEQLAVWVTQSACREASTQPHSQVYTQKLSFERVNSVPDVSSSRAAQSDSHDASRSRESPGKSVSRTNGLGPPIHPKPGDDALDVSGGLFRAEIDHQKSKRSQLSSESDEAISYVAANSEPNARPAEETQPRRASIDTAFGGVFFLLNVALHLRLYTDFTAPLGPNLDLNIWDFLALLGAAFTQDEIKKDELWGCLAELAGRSQESAPGASFQPPNEWHIPEDWLKPFEPVPAVEPFERDGRLVTLHPAGFVIADIPVANPMEQRIGDPTERWIAWLSGFVRARLMRACERPDAVELLSRCPARVAFTLTQVVVTFSLQSHPVEIRISGLDRDPGWIPAASRDVRFHFD